MVEQELTSKEKTYTIRAHLQTLINRALNSQLSHEMAGSLGLKIANTGLVFLSTVLLARVLGPEDYGVYSYVYAMVSLLSVPSEFGLPVLVVRETARGMAREDYSAVQGIWRWAGKVTGIISISLVVLTALALWILNEPLAGKKLLTFSWALALVPLVALGDLRGAALRGLQRVIAGQMPEFLIRPGLLVLFLAAAALFRSGELTAPNAMAIYVAASALAFGAGAWLLWRSTPAAVRWAAPRSESRAWLLSTLPLAFISSMQLVNNQASILLQGFYLPDAQIGIYRVAAQTSVLASFGLAAINMVVAPRFASLYAQDRLDRLQQLVTKTARVILGFNLLVTIGFVILGRPFLRIVFGSPYLTAYLPLLILLGGQLINSAAGSVGILLNMTGHETATARGMAVAAISNVLLNLILIPVLGIIGSALATAVSLITWNVMLWWAVRKRLGINSLAFG